MTAARTAHQLNGILTVISGNTELALLEGAALGDSARHSLEQVLEACRKGRDLVRELQARSRSEAGSHGSSVPSAEGGSAVPTRANLRPGLRVLLLDDEGPVARVGASLLEFLECSVCVTNQVQDAFEALGAAEEPFHLALLDYHLPEMGGEELVREVRRRAPETAVVVASGACAGLDRERLRALGVRAFLPKPFRAADLALLLQGL
ncbi:MAG: response regulator [Thermodesulfobacteriota bacterium]